MSRRSSPTPHCLRPPVLGPRGPEAWEDRLAARGEVARAPEAQGPGWVTQRLAVPADVMASLRVAAARPELVGDHHWRALEDRLERYVMRKVPPRVQGLRIGFDASAHQVVVHFETPSA